MHTKMKLAALLISMTWCGCVVIARAAQVPYAGTTHANVCHELDAARAAVQETLRSGVESNAVTLAMGLHDVARVLMKLRRWHDAEMVLLSVTSLADNACIDAHLEWCRAMRAYEQGNVDALTKHALRCVRLVPDVSWEPYHYAAVALHALRQERQAAALWLQGLAAFVAEIPIEELENYLDAALCYWKIFNVDEIMAWHAVMATIAEAHVPSPSNAAALTRALQERIKLEVMCSDVLGAHAATPRLRTEERPRWEHSPAGDWHACSTPVMRVPAELLARDVYEQAINHALLAEHAHDEARAARLYHTVIASGAYAQASAVRIQGATPLLFARARYARLSPTLIAHGTDAAHEALALCHEALRLAVTNMLRATSALADEELFQLLLTTADRTWYAGQSDDARTLYEWAFAVLPRATATRYLSSLFAANNDASLKSEQLYQRMRDLNTLPLLRPSWRMGERQYALLCEVALREGSSMTSPLPRVVACAFDVLEHDLMDMAAHPADACFCADPFARAPFAALRRARNAGVLDQQQCERMYDLTRRISVTIPATQQRMRTLLRARQELDAFVGLHRAHTCDLLLVCDARAWPAADTLWLLTDVASDAIALRRITACDEYPELFLDDVTGMWVGHLTLPPGIVAVRYKVAGTRDALFERHDGCWDGGFYIAATNENVARITITAPKSQ